MNYVQRVLQPDETLVYSTTLHWSVYLRAALFAIVALALLTGSQLAPQDEPAMAKVLLVAAGSCCGTNWLPISNARPMIAHRMARK